MIVPKYFTAIMFLGEDATGEDVNGIVVPTIEFDQIRAARKCDLIGDWIGELRGLYAICREQAENGEF